MPQPEVKRNGPAQESLTDLSSQMQKGFSNIENMLNKMQFEQDVANPTKIMSAAVHSYLNSKDSDRRKQALYDTCVQVSPCTRLDIFHTNMFRNNPRYVETFLENTQYGHNEIFAFRSYLVNTTTNLMLACTFCEEMMEVKSYSYSAGILTSIEPENLPINSLSSLPTPTRNSRMNTSRSTSKPTLMTTPNRP
ncbi:hypothetical protein L596_013126 [Steinernema carpocapsae]|uniref:Uncharacterized protein n=1 Tax=Steinernema carpocapsae TaxID=34508 RepID=A0A4U5NZ85_STECR|nr:hypothetical protein L596_013126 [Steinernema carpocapsae]